VGKSTLYNQFIREKSDKAEVGPVPGTTRENQEGDAGLFFIIDTPGADAIGNVGKAEHDEAFEAADDADFIILLFDAIQGIKQTELDLYDSVLRLKKPHILIMNKIDLTRKFRAEVMAKAAQNLQVEINEIIPISAIKGDGISKVVMSIAAMDPELVISLAQAMPKYRSKLAWRSIVSSSALSAAIALTPLPVIDFIPPGHHAIQHGYNHCPHLQLQDHIQTCQGAYRYVWPGDAGTHIVPTALESGRASRLAAFLCDRHIHDDCNGICIHHLV
jgi:small GTP-binding protein